MKFNTVIFLCVFVITVAMLNQYLYSEKPMYKTIECPPINTIDDIKKLFNYTPDTIQAQTQKVCDEAKKALEELIAIPAAQRTWENTGHALDLIVAHSHLAAAMRVFASFEYLHPEQAMRDAAHQAIQKLESFFIDQVKGNKALYLAFKEYAQGNALKESLSKDAQYFIEETLNDYKRDGLSLPDDQLALLSEKKKELALISQQFERAIADDNTKVTCTKDELAGLDDSFLAQLPQEDGVYTLGMDYPTIFAVLDHCPIEQTRKKISQAFVNRAYPQNEDLLKKIIALRNEIATMVGFASFADYELADQMVGSAARANTFIDDLINRTHEKVDLEFNRLSNSLPDGVTLDENRLIKPWDYSFIVSEYKKKHYSLDDRLIAQYFPMESTIEGLLDIYRQFFSIDFVIEKVEGFWHESVQLISVYTKNKEALIGYLLLDMYPRPNKFSHAAQLAIIPALIKNDKRFVGVTVVMANFPQSTDDKPSLLRRNDVETFFHEFGHALHSLLGATNLASYAGTNVKRDFVELPSQILEEWLYDPMILKKVSKHYQTGESLPDDIIKNIIELKQFSSGFWTQRQCILAKIALEYFGPGADKDPYTIMATLFERYSHGIAFDRQSHFYCSFGHLTGYGAKYYGYLWSKVFALDIFQTIKEHGLLNPEIGQRYIDCILSHGGSKHPDELLFDFLGREPSNKAFLNDLGLS